MSQHPRLFGIPSLLILGLTVLVWTGCVQHVDLPVVDPEQREVTILIPGYRGSFLQTPGPEGEVAWVRPAQLLGNSERSLALPFPGQRPALDLGVLENAGPVTGFTVIPFLGEYEVYGPLMRFGREQLPGFIVHGYDWRRDIRESGAGLCQRIEALASARGGALKVNLVAHSMGGLVALECLRGGADGGWSATAQKVQKLFIFGTPFDGAPGIFDDFFLGTPLGRNERLMGPDAVFSFPAAFQLLPPTGDFLLRSDGSPSSLELDLPETWTGAGWSVFADPTLVGNAAYRTHLARMLAGHAAVFSPLPQEPAPFSSRVVIGQGHSTVESFPIAPDGKVDLKAARLGDGDGTVLAQRARPPGSLHAQLLFTDAEHVEMLRRPELLRALELFLKAPQP
ncbi:MAG: hypothetical protein M3Y59_17120 [Myxococcota bacterium]|nr:hypothetical protein [Myxococcota bacterium]